VAITNTGAITVNNGGALTTTVAVTTTAGTIMVQGTGTVTAAGAAFVGTGGKFQPTTATSSFTYGTTYSITGSVSVIGAYTLDAGKTFTVPAGSTLTINAAALTLVDTPITTAGTGTAAEIIITGASSKITLGTAPTNNYYTLAGVGIVGTDIDTIGTYTWDAAAGGAATPGWKRDS
jgi:hypothetical protein